MLGLRHSSNKLLQGRGLPGTHDVELAINIIQQLKNPDPQTLLIPSYNKAAFNGEGDRSSNWIELQRPIDVVMFDGWFLGILS